MVLGLASVQAQVPYQVGYQTSKYVTVSSMSLSTTLLQNNNNGIFTGDVNLTEDTGYYFVFWNYDKRCPAGPSKTVSLSDLAVGQSATYDFIDNTQYERGYCWQGVPAEDGEVTYSVSVNWQTMQATITNLGKVVEIPEDTYNVTIKIKAENFTMNHHYANYLHIIDLFNNNAQLPITSTTVDVEYTATKNGFVISTVPGYELSFECANYTGDPSKAPFQIDGVNPMADDEVLDFGTQWTLMLAPGADGLVFDAVVKRVPQTNLPSSLYAMVAETAITQNSQLKPGNNDPKLEYNPETGYYEGVMTLGKRRFKFYVLNEDGEGYTVLGQNGQESEGFINFNRQLAPYKGDCAWDASSCWYMAYTFNNNAEQTVKMQVDVPNGVVIFTPVLPPAPNQLYVWGSMEGFYNQADATVTGTINKIEGTSIFKGTVNVPYVAPGTWTDPDTGAAYPYEGWSFKIGYNRNITNTGMFAAQGDSYFIDFDEAWKFSAPLTGEYALNTLYTGNMEITFNWETLELTAVNPDAPQGYHVTFDFNYNDEPVLTAELRNYVSFFDVESGEEINVNANPYPYYYNADQAMIVIGAQAGYEVSIECSDWDGEDSTDAPFSISSISPMAQDDEVLEFGSQWNMLLRPAADNFNFVINIKETVAAEVATVGVENDAVTVYNLQGVRVLSGDSKTALNRLPKGIYIVNGKKTVLR